MTATLDPLPACSVIIPTYNRPAALVNSLRALSEQDYPVHRFEVVVVDDGGAVDLSSGTNAFRGRLDLNVMKQRNTGPGPARNTGVAAAKYEAIAFIDDDCTAHRNWLRALMEALGRNPDALIGGASHNALRDNLYASASQMILDVVDRHFNRNPQNATFFPSENMALARRRFEEIGGFDPSFRWSEDRDLCDRWSARGWRLVIASDAIVDHAHQMDFVGFCKQHFGYGRGACRFHRERQLRGTGQLEVEGSFYLKCFREPFRAARFPESVALAGLMGVWQVANIAGFLYEMSLAARRPGAPAPL